MNRNPYINALLASLYIAGIALLFFYGTKMFGPAESVLIPIGMLSLFTLSAAVMGYLFCLLPLQLFLDGKRKEAVQIFSKTVGTFAVLTVLVLGAALYVSKTVSEPAVIEPYRTTLEGQYVCLPHRTTAGPQTAECTFGIQVENGDYYAIDFSLMSQNPPESIPTGKTIRATGVITPVGSLNSTHWQIYPIKGIFSVTDSLQLM